MQVVVSDSEVPLLRDVERWTRKTLGAAKHSEGAVTLRVVSEAEMASYNEQFRGQSGATNELSFPFEAPPGVRTGILGDIVVCPAVLRQEVEDSTTSLAAHWAHMFIHGMLHLCGYDHQSDSEATAMQSVESDVLKALGFPDPYRVF